jgi:epoxyqueuosine reductase
MILEEFRRLEPPTREAFHRSARQSGFELSGIANALPSTDLPLFDNWVHSGYAGQLGYLIDHRADIRRDPRLLLPSARSIFCLGKLYKTVDIADPAVSRYAWGAEIPRTLRAGLTRLVDRTQRLWGDFDHRIAVDTAPL